MNVPTFKPIGKKGAAVILCALFTPSHQLHLVHRGWFIWVFVSVFIGQSEMRKFYRGCSSCSYRCQDFWIPSGKVTCGETEQRRGKLPYFLLLVRWIVFRRTEPVRTNSTRSILVSSDGRLEIKKTRIFKFYHCSSHLLEGNRSGQEIIWTKFGKFNTDEILNLSPL